MHRPEDAVVIVTIPFGTLASLGARQQIEGILAGQGIRYRVVQDALTLTPGPQIRRMLVDREPPRLYVLVAAQDYEQARRELGRDRHLQRYIEAQAL